MWREGKGGLFRGWPQADTWLEPPHKVHNNESMSSDIVPQQAPFYALDGAEAV